MDKNKNSQSKKAPQSSGPVENILPTTNEQEMQKLMKDLDREQAYREHKCWRQYVTVILSIIFVVFFTTIKYHAKVSLNIFLH